MAPQRHTKREKDLLRKRVKTARKKTTGLGQDCRTRTINLWWDFTHGEWDGVVYVPEGESLPDMNLIIQQLWERQQDNSANGRHGRTRAGELAEAEDQTETTETEAAGVMGEIREMGRTTRPTRSTRLTRAARAAEITRATRASRATRATPTRPTTTQRPSSALNEITVDVSEDEDEDHEEDEQSSDDSTNMSSPPPSPSCDGGRESRTAELAHDHETDQFGMNPSRLLDVAADGYDARGACGTSGAYGVYGAYADGNGRAVQVNGPEGELCDLGMMGSSMLGPSTMGPSLMGPSTVVPSITDPSTMGPSMMGPSMMGPSDQAQFPVQVNRCGDDGGGGDGGGAGALGVDWAGVSMTEPDYTSMLQNDVWTTGMTMAEPPLWPGSDMPLTLDMDLTMGMDMDLDTSMDLDMLFSASAVPSLGEGGSLIEGGNGNIGVAPGMATEESHGLQILEGPQRQQLQHQPDPEPKLQPEPESFTKHKPESEKAHGADEEVNANHVGPALFPPMIVSRDQDGSQHAQGWTPLPQPQLSATPQLSVTPSPPPSPPSPSAVESQPQPTTDERAENSQAHLVVSAALSKRARRLALLQKIANALITVTSASPVQCRRKQDDLLGDDHLIRDTWRLHESARGGGARGGEGKGGASGGGAERRRGGRWTGAERRVEAERRMGSKRRAAAAAVVAAAAERRRGWYRQGMREVPGHWSVEPEARWSAQVIEL